MIDTSNPVEAFLQDFCSFFQRTQCPRDLNFESYAMDVKNTELVEFMQDLHRVYNKLGHFPTMSEYSKHGKHNGSTYECKFGSWNQVILRSVGFIKQQKNNSFF